MIISIGKKNEGGGSIRPRWFFSVPVTLLLSGLVGGLVRDSLSGLNFYGLSFTSKIHLDYAVLVQNDFSALRTLLKLNPGDRNFCHDFSTFHDFQPRSVLLYLQLIIALFKLGLTDYRSAIRVQLG